MKAAITSNPTGAAFLAEVPAVFERADRAVRVAQRGGRGEVGQLHAGYTGSTSFNEIVPIPSGSSGAPTRRSTASRRPSDLQRPMKIVGNEPGKRGGADHEHRNQDCLNHDATQGKETFWRAIARILRFCKRICSGESLSEGLPIALEAAGYGRTF